MVRIGTGPPFWQINHANSAYFRLFLGYFQVIWATRPPLFTYPGSTPVLWIFLFGGGGEGGKGKGEGKISLVGCCLTQLMNDTKEAPSPLVIHYWCKLFSVYALFVYVCITATAFKPVTFWKICDLTKAHFLKRALHTLPIESLWDL